MNDLAQAVAFLESLGLAHGDLRPENIPLDRNQLKLSDFDCTAKIGTGFDACIPPYGRILNANEADQGHAGSSGLLGPRTEQFALGSLYYLINYGFEVYGDRRLTEDSREHGPKVVELLQHMKLPALDKDSLSDDIIDKCWHNKYSTVAELAAHTKKLLGEGTNEAKHKQDDGDAGDSLRHAVNQVYSTEDLLSRKAVCEDLEKRGLLDMLASGEPEQLGFTLEWYRHSS